jgi:hypothetical protein
MSTALSEIMRQAEELSLAEQLELIVYLAQHSRRLAEAAQQHQHRTWSEIGGILDQPLFGEDVQSYISRSREESDRAFTN